MVTVVTPSKATTSYPPPKEATSAEAFASSAGFVLSNFRLYRAATAGRDSILIPSPVTCTSFVSAGIAERKEKSSLSDGAISCTESTAKISGRSARSRRKSFGIDTPFSSEITLPSSTLTRQKRGATLWLLMFPFWMSIPKTVVMRI